MASLRQIVDGRVPDSLILEAGGPGSGCNPAAGTCGRRSGAGSGSSGAPMHKQLGLPGGKGARLQPNGDYEWTKRGGYYNKMADVHKRAQAAGFTRVEHQNSASPGSGETVRHGVLYRHPNGSMLHIEQSYGVTAPSNRHSIRLWRE